MLPSSNDLYYFIEVCQTLNLSRASERLGISQPSLSSAVKRLEHAIGTSLFIRIKNGLKLTKSGEQFYNHAKQLIHLWETARAESLASVNEIQGDFVLGCHPSVAQYHLPLFMPKLLEQYPQIRITLKHDLSRKILEGIINFSIDIGIVVNPVRHRDLILQKLYDDEVGFWQPKDKNLMEEQKMLTLLCDVDLLQTQKLLKDLEAMGIKEYRLLPTSNLDVIASLTAAGCGVGILPRSVVYTHHQPLLSQVPNTPTFHDEIYLAYRPEQRHVKALQVMVQTIRDSCKNLQT
ncbi:TPA: LysR family transcriptional regulator [Legionella anisa]|nr:LysR family transcriptional regulator [Legionella anisa]MBN5935344.1 LysR family transcriptional regulator [Legionella anisa]MCW8426387.1 LysR family transcriptional regulator [Legionella anisa]MCW8448047.1 LysR family transcriptional regulator [Legionella anisa]UAK78674.1 LysR family transcriptional regulator [Legionella anisa]